MRRSSCSPSPILFLFADCRAVASRTCFNWTRRGLMHLMDHLAGLQLDCTADLQLVRVVLADIVFSTKKPLRMVAYRNPSRDSYNLRRLAPLRNTRSCQQEFSFENGWAYRDASLLHCRAVELENLTSDRHLPCQKHQPTPRHWYVPTKAYSSYYMC